MSSPPDWDCTNEAARKRFEAWTNEQLDLLDEELDEPPMGAEGLEPPTVEDLERGEELPFDLTPGKIAQAVEQRDYKELARLTAKRRDLLTLMFRLQDRKRRRGRRKGDPRPSDLPQVIKDVLPLVSTDVDRIRHIWKKTYNRTNRTEAPTALEIAARRWNIEPEIDSLINYRKNLRRK
jgi:hypothetical protein